MPKGGVRPNSGRKPKDPAEVRVMRAFRVAPATSEAIDRLAEARGIPASHVIDALVAEAGAC